jgi:hypothetical protein
MPREVAGHVRTPQGCHVLAFSHDGTKLAAAVGTDRRFVINIYDIAGAGAPMPGQG